MAEPEAEEEWPAHASFLGLPPFLRQSIAGDDLRSCCRKFVAQAEAQPGDPAVLMNLSIALQCIGERELGLAVQDQALKMQRVYRLAAIEQPARLRVLMLMTAGDIAANTPLECLLETGDIELVHYYLTPGDPFAIPLPEHDVVVVALSESAENREFLNELQRNLAGWPKPVINAPQHVPSTDRHVASILLQNAPGLCIPLTQRASRDALLQIANGNRHLPDCLAATDFPVIVRPIDSQAGRDLSRLECASDLADYLAAVDRPDFFISRFVDYRGRDGLFRKYRLAMIDGTPYACHMGVSSHWMVHYVNAGMYDDAWKRSEEAKFLATFDDFARRHEAALAAIHERIPLDYLCIDCAETPDGRFLVFEVDHCMVVHAMDSPELFPYKQIPMQQVKSAFRNYLLRRHEAA